MPLVAVLQPILTIQNDGVFQYEPSEMVAEYTPRIRNFILGIDIGFSNSNILLVIALALLLIVTISLVTIRCRKWRKAHSKGNTSQVKCFPYSLGRRDGTTVVHWHMSQLHFNRYFQWPITDEIFSKVERITNTDSDPSTSSLPPYNAIPFDNVTVQAVQSAHQTAQKERHDDFLLSKSEISRLDSRIYLIFLICTFSTAFSQPKGR